MRKTRVFNRTAIAIAVSTVFLLSACAGGGGGSGVSNPGNGSLSTPGQSPGTTLPTPTSPVPFATPERVGSITPINSLAYESDSSALYSENITGSGESLITAGRAGSSNGGAYPTYNLNIFNWEGGQLVNRTSQWFIGTDNVITGTEPSVKFGDFNGDSKKDMYVAPNTDNTPVGSGWMFLSDGSKFSRVDLGLNINGHDSAIYDLNGDGADDIFTTGSRVTFGSLTNNFTSHTVSGRDYGGTAGSVALADFLGTGGSSVILTDQNSFQTGGTRLYNWSMTDSGRPTLDFELNLISTLPASRFFLPKYSVNGFSGSHDYRALAFDFDNSGRTSAVVFSRPVMSDGSWPDFNEIQFLKNQGGGSFIDVTDTTLVGYNTASSSQHYNPELMDVNSDGLTDIVLAGTSWTGNTGAQVLIHTSEHKYVASYGAVIDAFVGQATTLEKQINASATSGANGIVFVKGPDNSMYLATAISYNGGGQQQKAIYLSKLGATTASAQATATSIKQVWPWMNDAQVNTVLAASSTDYYGMSLLDSSRAFQPVGIVSIPLSSGFSMPISGYVMGLGLDNADTVVTDSVGRTFNTSLNFMNVSGTNAFGYNTQHNDQYSLTSHAEYLVNGTPVTAGNMRIATETRYGFNGDGLGASISTASTPKQYSVGIPEIYRNGKFSYGAQYTSLNSNPWMAFGGAWGSINNSGILDHVVTYRNGGFSTQASLMNVTTNITPGLITKVNNITGAWAESGYRYTNMDDFGDLGLFAGVKPVVLSGDVEARMPTGVDNDGNITYTNKKLAVQNQVTPYIRALYTTKLDKRTMYRFSAMGTQQGQYRLMHELKFWID